jgi:hypothetical protein
MAPSDQLSKLSVRAKEVEDRVAAAQGKAKADLQAAVKEARDEAQSQADALRKSAEASKGKVSAWWQSVQRSWDEHLKAVRKNVAEKRAEHDANAARTAADQAEDDAAFAVDFAYAAIEEAEYAVLDASLARMQADELAGTAS